MSVVTVTVMVVAVAAQMTWHEVCSDGRSEQQLQRSYWQNGSPVVVVEVVAVVYMYRATYLIVVMCLFNAASPT